MDKLDTRFDPGSSTNVVRCRGMACRGKVCGVVMYWIRRIPGLTLRSGTNVMMCCTVI
jgi:hypothetical protein